MTPIFLDTAYVFALINTRDKWHTKAKALEHDLNAELRPLVTSEFVLTEIADGLSSINFREKALQIIDALHFEYRMPLVTSKFTSQRCAQYSFEDSRGM